MGTLDFNKTFDEQMLELRHATRKLEVLSEAFYVTGNDVMCSKLDSLFNTIITVEQTLTDAYRKDISDQLNAQSKQIGKTFAALVN